MKNLPPFDDMLKMSPEELTALHKELFEDAIAHSRR